MKGYFINLDSSVERLKTFDHRLTQLGFLRICNDPICWKKGTIEIERLSAVDGRLMTSVELDSCRQTQVSFWDWTTHQLTPGEIGCFLSHRKFWTSMLSDEQTVSFVIEDDIELSKDILDFLGDLSWVPEDADFVKFNLFPTNSKKIYPIGHSVSFVKGRKVARTIGRIYGTGCYLITAKAAKLCLEKSLKMVLPVDLFMFDARFAFAPTTKLYTVLPGLATDDNLTPSTIGGKRNKDRLTLLQHVLKGFYSLARRLRLKQLMRQHALHWERGDFQA